MEDQSWREEINKKLDDIYSELTDGAIRKGLFSQTKQNTGDINVLKSKVDEHDEVIQDYKTFKKWSINAFGAGLLVVLGKLVWILVDWIKLAWKAVPFIAELFSRHNSPNT